MKVSYLKTRSFIYYLKLYKSLYVLARFSLYVLVLTHYNTSFKGHVALGHQPKFAWLYNLEENYRSTFILTTLPTCHRRRQRSLAMNVMKLIKSCCTTIEGHKSCDLTCRPIDVVDDVGRHITGKVLYKSLFSF